MVGEPGATGEDAFAALAMEMVFHEMLLQSCSSRRIEVAGSLKAMLVLYLGQLSKVSAMVVEFYLLVVARQCASRSV